LKTTVIAEIGSNWEGSISKARKIISECKKAGANAVKFQMWRANDLYTRDHPQLDIIKKSELTFPKAKEIKMFCDKIGIEFFCSVFYPEGVDFLETLKVKRYKVASRTCLLNDPHSLATLQKIAQIKKSIIISMGMGGNRKFIENIFAKNKTVFCYCISEYPLKLAKINWKEAVRFDGFSDHTMGTTAAILFAVIKKQRNAKNILIEKHVKLESSKGPDSSTSITTKELSSLISHIRIIEQVKII